MRRHPPCSSATLASRARSTRRPRSRARRPARRTTWRPRRVVGVRESADVSASGDRSHLFFTAKRNGRTAPTRDLALAAVRRGVRHVVTRLRRLRGEVAGGGGGRDILQDVATHSTHVRMTHGRDATWCITTSRMGPTCASHRSSSQLRATVESMHAARRRRRRYELIALAPPFTGRNIKELQQAVQVRSERRA